MWPLFVDVRIQRGKNEMTVRMSLSRDLILDDYLRQQAEVQISIHSLKQVERRQSRCVRGQDGVAVREPPHALKHRPRGDKGLNGRV